MCSLHLRHNVTSTSERPTRAHFHPSPLNHAGTNNPTYTSTYNNTTNSCLPKRSYPTIQPWQTSQHTQSHGRSLHPWQSTASAQPAATAFSTAPTTDSTTTTVTALEL